MKMLIKNGWELIGISNQEDLMKFLPNCEPHQVPNRVALKRKAKKDGAILGVFEADHSICQPASLIDSMIQTCSILGLHIFPDTGSSAYCAEISSVKFHNNTNSNKNLNVHATLKEKENDYTIKDPLRKFICHFDATAKNGKVLITEAKISIAITSPREMPDLIMPSLTPEQREDGWKKLMETNADAIKKACGMGPRPGDLGCD